MKSKSSRIIASSLVEITLALGVASFCLVSIFGLLPVGITSNKVAIDQTLTNGILSTVVADLRSCPRTCPLGQTGTSSQFAIPIPPNPITTSPADTTLYFTAEGAPSTAADLAGYRVTVTFLPNGTGEKSATLVRLTASWPAMLPIAKASGTVGTFCALERN